MNGEAEDGRIHVSALKSRAPSARAARTVRDEATRGARTAERVTRAPYTHLPSISSEGSLRTQIIYVTHQFRGVSRIRLLSPRVDALEFSGESRERCAGWGNEVVVVVDDDDEDDDNDDGDNDDNMVENNDEDNGRGHALQREIAIVVVVIVVVDARHII